MLHRRQDLSTLAADLRAGEPAAFRTLVRDLTPPLLARALSIVKDFGAAQDVLQQAFLRIFINRDRLPDTDPSIRGYCFRVLIHLAFDHLRNSRLRKLRETQATTSRTEILAATAAPIDDDPERQAMANEAWELAMSLPEPIRDVLMLRFGLGLTIRETADALALPVGTVSTRQRSGLEALREQIRQAALVPFAAGVTAAVGVDQVASLLVASSEKAANSFSAAVLRSIESAVLGKISGSVSTSTTALTIIVTAAALVVAIGLGTGHAPANPAAKFAPVRSSQHGSTTADRPPTASRRPGYAAVDPTAADSAAAGPTAGVDPMGRATGSATNASRPTPPSSAHSDGRLGDPAPAPRIGADASLAPPEAANEWAGVHGVVLDSANRPVAGVPVWPILDGATAGTVADAADFHSPDFALAAVTDYSGRFAINGLNPAISYRLWVPETAEFLAAVRYAPSLRPGEIVDAGLIRLVRPGLLVGTVSDRTGIGIERATVHARPMKAAIDGGSGGDAGRAGTESGSAGLAADQPLGLPGGGAASPVDPSVATDATGHFRFDRLLPGLYALTIFAPGFRTAQITAVRIREGEMAAPMAVTLIGGFELAVTVTNVHGHAVPHAVVRVSSYEFSGTRPTAVSDGILVIADALGFARVENISAPRIQLGVEAQGYGRHADTIVLPTDGPLAWHVTLRSGARLVGRAVDARSGHSIPNPQITGSTTDATGQQSTVTVTGDTAGRFALADLPAGWCRVEILAPNYAPLTIGPVMLDMGTAVELGSCRMTALTALTVAVVDAEDRPLSGASVTATPIGGGPPIASAQTGATGLATLVALVPGATIELTVQKAGFVAHTVSQRVPVEPAENQPCVVVVLLSNGATIYGTARRLSGAVWPNAAVSLIRRDGTAADVRWADAAGQFVFAAVAPGEYALVAADEPSGLKSKAQAPMHASTAGSQWVSVAAGELIEDGVAWEMTEQTVHGRLLLDIGKPAADWYVAAGEPSIGEKGAWVLGRIIAETITDANGWFELPDRHGDGPAPIIQAIGPDGSSTVFAWPTTTAATAGSSHWNFVVASAALEHSGEIHGTVVTANSGEPAVQVSVVVERIPVTSTSRLFRRETHTDKTGHFWIDDLPAGRYRITVCSPHFATCVIECDVAERTTVAPIIELRLGESMTVVAIASAGSSAAKVVGPITVTLVGPHSFSLARTAAFGQPITFTGLVVGETYTLTITALGFRPHTKPLTITTTTARSLLEFTLRPQ